MENARIVQQSELTTAFTRDGKILVPIDENGKLTILPKYCVGIRDGYQKNLARNEVGFFLHKNYAEDESEYKRQITEELGKIDKRHSEKQIIEEGWLTGNIKVLTDMGELTKSIYPFQVQEMKVLKSASFIRDGRNTFYLTTTTDNLEVFENVGYRFLLLPRNFNESHLENCSLFPLADLEAFTLSQPDDCTLDLLVAMRQLDKSEVQKFVNEVIREPQKSNEEVVKE